MTWRQLHHALLAIFSHNKKAPNQTKSTNLEGLYRQLFNLGCAESGARTEARRARLPAPSRSAPETSQENKSFDFA